MSYNSTINHVGGGHNHTQSYTELHCNLNLIHRLYELCFSPRELEKRVLPIGFEGKDLIVEAEDGSGKTSCFVILAANIVYKTFGRSTAVVILTSTSEDVYNIQKGIELLIDLPVLTFSGNPTDDAKQMRDLTYPVIVAVPQVLAQLVQVSLISIEDVELLIVTKPDQYSKTTIQNDMKTILSFTNPSTTQYAIFSNDTSHTIQQCIGSYLKDPFVVHHDFSESSSSICPSNAEYINASVTKYSRVDMLKYQAECSSEVQKFKNIIHNCETREYIASAPVTPNMVSPNEFRGGVSSSLSSVYRTTPTEFRRSYRPQYPNRTEAIPPAILNTELVFYTFPSLEPIYGNILNLKQYSRDDILKIQSQCSSEVQKYKDIINNCDTREYIALTSVASNMVPSNKFHGGVSSSLPFDFESMLNEFPRLPYRNESYDEYLGAINRTESIPPAVLNTERVFHSSPSLEPIYGNILNLKQYSRDDILKIQSQCSSEVQKYKDIINNCDTREYIALTSVASNMVPSNKFHGGVSSSLPFDFESMLNEFPRLPYRNESYDEYLGAINRTESIPPAVLNTERVFHSSPSLEPIYGNILDLKQYSRDDILKIQSQCSSEVQKYKDIINNCDMREYIALTSVASSMVSSNEFYGEQQNMPPSLPSDFLSMLNEFPRLPYRNESFDEYLAAINRTEAIPPAILNTETIYGNVSNLKQYSRDEMYQLKSQSFFEVQKYKYIEQNRGIWTLYT